MHCQSKAVWGWMELLIKDLIKGYEQGLKKSMVKAEIPNYI